jgi:hypothetical protein
MSALRSIQAAVFAVLSGDATLTALASVIGDIGPTRTYPFVLVGDGIEKPWHGLGGSQANKGYNDILRTHVYSSYQGDSEALTILARLTAVLDFATLTVAGYGSVLCEYEQGRVLRETDADRLEVRHIPAEFRVRVRQ